MERQCSISDPHGHRRLFFMKSVVVLCLTLFFVFGAGMADQGECKTWRLKFQMAWHTQHPQYKAYMEFIKRVKEATNGQLKFTVFPASQLIGRNEALDGLKNGTIDMLASCGAYYHGMVPEGDVDWLPYVSLNRRAPFWELMNNQEGGAEGEFHDIILMIPISQKPMPCG